MTEPAQWTDLLTAVATAGAAVFAGLAARSAGASARAANEVVDLERMRDQAASLTRAQGVTLDLISEDLDGWMYVHALIVNSSPTPFLRARVRIRAGASEWGPQLIGHLLPGTRLEVMCRLPSANDLVARVRFYDAEGDAWIAVAGGGVVRATDSPEDWIEDGRRFAASVTRPYEQGWWSRTAPDFDAFRAMMDEEEGRS